MVISNTIFTESWEKISVLVWISPWYVVFGAGICCTMLNVVFNSISTRGANIHYTLQRWTRLLRLTRHTVVIEEVVEENKREYDESDQLLHTGSISQNHRDNAFFFHGMTNPSAVVDAPPVVPASVVKEALRDSLQHVRLEAQQLVFLYNPKYMMIATAKSLTMLVVLQYHYDYRGGWDRLVVCSAANLMSGLLTPVLEYAAGMLLPIDSKRDRRSLGVEVEEPRDSVLIVEVLMRIGQLELEDLETVLIQGATFIIFGAILLPALLIFCVPGFAAYPWVFFPPWIVYAVLRYFYYREGGLLALPLPVGQQWTGSLFSSPVGEVSKAVLMKIITLFLLQWTLQCSFLFGFVLLDGWSYHDGLRLEAEHQLWGWYNPKEMTRFHWICFASQLFF